MVETKTAIQPSPSLWLTAWIDRYRYWWFAFTAIFLLFSINGQWHIGPDSAAYRALGYKNKDGGVWLR